MPKQLSLSNLQVALQLREKENENFLLLSAFTIFPA